MPFCFIQLILSAFHELIKIKPHPSSIGILHTNLASIYKYHDNLVDTLSLFKFKFHIIGITEHKIKGDIPINNIEIPGSHISLYDASSTTHGGTGFYIKNSFAYKKREDLKLKSPAPGEFESTFLEIIIPNKKNQIVGCIYSHPSSSISIEDFSKEYWNQCYFIYPMKIKYVQ